MTSRKFQRWFSSLLGNIRFWVLITGIAVSVCVAGFIQLLIPSGSLQIIRIEQFFGFISVLLLYLAMLASPLTKAYPNLPLKGSYLHARRAIGVLAFYYALLHAALAFYKQLGGPDGIQYYSSKYNWSLLFGVVSLAILFVMTVTSLDWAVQKLSFKRWKLLHRLVYLAGLSILIHVVLIGSHYEQWGFLSSFTAVAVTVLLWLEGLRIIRNFAGKGHVKKKHK